jgi:hypothetical protein
LRKENTRDTLNRERRYHRYRKLPYPLRPTSPRRIQPLENRRGRPIRPSTIAEARG